QRVRRSPGTHVRSDLRFLDPLHAVSALLHHATHAHGDVWILLHLDRVGRSFFRERPEIFTINGKLTGNFLFPDRPLGVIEIIEAANLEWAVVRAIARADATVVSHDIESVFAVHGGVDRADGFARRVFAMLAHHRLVDELGIFRPFTFVLI